MFTRVSGADFLELIFNQFYDRGAIEMLPQLIRQTADQDYGPLAQMLSFYDMKEDSRAFADGMHLSVVCGDRMPPAATPKNLRCWRAGRGIISTIGLVRFGPLQNRSNQMDRARKMRFQSCC